MRRRRALPASARGHGLTLVELLVSMAILTVIASIAIPAYQDGLEDSQVAEARVEVRGIEMKIERYFQINGFFPETLAEVGMEDALDPWGNPYRYLRLQAPPPASAERAAAKAAEAAERAARERAPEADAAAGDDAAAAATAEAPAAAGPDAAASGSSGSGGSGSGARAARGGSGTATTGGGTTAGAAGGDAGAAGDGAAGGGAAGGGAAGGGAAAAGGGAAAAGGGAGAAGGAGGAQGQARKDHNLVPINTDFDLYSMGPDGRSAPPLTASMSRDDIVRGNNGRYIGEASGY